MLHNQLQLQPQQQSSINKAPHSVLPVKCDKYDKYDKYDTMLLFPWLHYQLQLQLQPQQQSSIQIKRQHQRANR
jgi:hypothetical protein